MINYDKGVRQVAEVTILEDVMVCAEVIFTESEVPFERYYFGNLIELARVLGPTFLENEAKKNDATSAYVQNIYVRARTKDSKTRGEFRIGIHGEVDMEAFILEEEQ